MLLSNSKARLFTQEAPVHRCVASSANIICFKVVLPTKKLSQEFWATASAFALGMAMPNAVLAAAPGLSVPLALQ